MTTLRTLTSVLRVRPVCSTQTMFWLHNATEMIQKTVEALLKLPFFVVIPYRNMVPLCMTDGVSRNITLKHLPGLKDFIPLVPLNKA